MTLLLRTKGACEFDPGYLLDVFAGQRRRFAAVLQGVQPVSGRHRLARLLQSR